MVVRFLYALRGTRLFVVASLLVIGMLGCEKTDADAGAGNASTPTTAPAAAGLADGHLAGLYVRQQSVPFFFNGRMTFNLYREFFYFFPDGHVLYGLPTEGNVKEHPTAADFADFAGVEPELRGTYAVKDGSITFHHEKGDKDVTEPFSIPKAGDDTVLQIGVPSVVGSVKALPFKDGQKLDGSYQFNGTIGQRQAITIFNVNTLNFRPDGTLGSDQLSGVQTEGIHTTVGDSGVSAHSQTTTPGTYHFNGYILETTIGGKAVKATVFRWAGDDKPSPGLLCISGRVYTHYEAKK